MKKDNLFFEKAYIQFESASDKVLDFLIDRNINFQQDVKVHGEFKTLIFFKDNRQLSSRKINKFLSELIAENEFRLSQSKYSDFDFSIKFNPIISA